MKTTNQPTTKRKFKSFFAAETYLEKKGYFCKNGQWIHGREIATLDKVADSVQIKFKH